MPKIDHKCLIALLFCLFQADRLYAGQIAADEFGQIREVSEYFLKICPPKQCILIGAGRSPVPFVAYIQALKAHDNYAWNVPLSKFRYGIGEIKPLSPDQENKLYQHFDNYMPTTAQIQGRYFLVADFGINYGHTALAFQKYLRKYLAKKFDVAPQVQSVLIAGSDKDLDDGSAFGFNHIVVLRKDTKLYQKLNGQAYDNDSEFGSFDIRSDDVAARQPTRKEYGAFMADLKKVSEGVNSDAQLGSGQQPDFVVIEQNGKPDTLMNAKSKGTVKNYLHQLSFYDGADLKDRYRALLLDPDTKTEVYRQLPRIKDSEIRDEVAKDVLHEKNVIGLLSLSEPGLREQYLQGSDPFSADPLVIVRDGLRDKDPDVRVRAAKELLRRNTHDPEIHHSLIESLQDANVAVRGVTYWTLANLKPSDKESLEALMRLLRHGDSNVRSSAAQILAAINPSDSAFRQTLIHALVAALRDKLSYLPKDSNGANGIVSALASLKPTDTTTLKELADLMLDSEQASDIRRATARALGRIEPKDFALHEALVMALKDPELGVRFEAASAIKSLYKSSPNKHEIKHAIASDADWDSFKIPLASDEQIQRLLTLMGSAH